MNNFALTARRHLNALKETTCKLNVKERKIRINSYKKGVIEFSDIGVI